MGFLSAGIPFFTLFASALLVFSAMDLLWIGVIARRFYRDALGHLLSDRTNWGAGITFYVVYILGLLFFALLPAKLIGSPFSAALLGGMYGFFTYATYDLTNYATLRDWPLRFVAVDMLWGTSLSSITALAAFVIERVIL